MTVASLEPADHRRRCTSSPSYEIICAQHRFSALAQDESSTECRICLSYRKGERSEDPEQAEQVEGDGKQGVTAVCRRPPPAGGALWRAAGCLSMGTGVGRRQGLGRPLRTSRQVGGPRGDSRCRAAVPGLGAWPTARAVPAKVPDAWSGRAWMTLERKCQILADWPDLAKWI
jgi:hypothetical protein